MAAAILLLGLGMLAGEARSPDAAARVERQVYLMGTRATLTALAADRARGLYELERILDGLETAEAELSTWREDSVLAALNRQPVGVASPAPDWVCQLLDELRTWQAATAGAFDPAVASLIEVWGLRQGGRSPSPAELARARRDAGLDQVEVRSDPCRVTRLRDVRIDSGAFGKGAAIDRVAASEWGRSGSWLVDLGGQVAVGGLKRPWPVALAHPQRRSEPALELLLASGSLATSGGSERDLLLGSRRIGHILDPRTGWTVSRPSAVTVWHDSALVADVLSTALYVMGREAGLVWAEARGIAACFLSPESGGDTVASSASSAFALRFLSPVDPQRSEPVVE